MFLPDETNPRALYILSPPSLINIPFSKLIKSSEQMFILNEILSDEMLNLITKI